MEINFFLEEIQPVNLDKVKYIEWIKLCIKKYLKRVGDLNFIFCSDTYLLDINKKYLNHDYYTDIITFDYCKDNVISGDIYISVDRVEENSKKFKVTFNEELHRVIIHGILHLLGLNDATDEEKKNMRNAEDDCIGFYKKNN